MHVARCTVGDALPCAQSCLIFALYQQKTYTNFLMSNKKWKGGVVYTIWREERLGRRDWGGEDPKQSQGKEEGPKQSGGEESLGEERILSNLRGKEGGPKEEGAISAS
jgi:hypothetical protein